MKYTDYIPPAIKRAIRRLFLSTRKQRQPLILDIVKSNTREAWEYFWEQDEYINKGFFEPDRLALYQLIAEYCKGVLKDYNVAGAIQIADIGCGQNNMLKALRDELVPECDEMELFGLDFAISAIRKAKELLPMTKFVVGDIYKIPLLPDFFDLVLCIETLEHLRRPKDALLELLNICKPGGSVVITVPNGERDSFNGHVNFWNIAQFKNLLTSYGLVHIKLVIDDTIIMARLLK